MTFIQFAFFLLEEPTPNNYPWWVAGILAAIAAVTPLLIKWLDKRECENNLKKMIEENKALRAKNESLKIAHTSELNTVKKSYELKYDELLVKYEILQKEYTQVNLNYHSLKSAVIMMRKYFNDKGFEDIPGIDLEP